MAREGSVAPKERINIVYKSKLAGQPDVELPFKMLVMADLTGKPNTESVEERKPINIDKDNFTDVMGSLNLGVDISVDNKLQEGNAHELAAHLKFNSLQDFTPDGIAQQVPELRKLLELRDALSALKSPLGNRPEFRKRIQSIVSDDDTRKRITAELGLDKTTEEK